MIKFLLAPLIVLFIHGDSGKVVNDLMLVGNLKSQDTVSRDLKIQGKTISDIEIFPDSNTQLITCQFIDQSGMVGLEQRNVEKCSGHLDTPNPMTLTIKVTNPNCVDIGYKVHLVEKKK